MTKSKRLVFFGTDDFSAAVLEEILVSGWAVSAVVTKPDSPAGRGQKIVPPAVKQIALEHKIKVLQPDKSSDIAAGLKDIDTEWGVLAAYGKIIPPAVLDMFSGGIVNIHPSLLPKYRGPAPIESAILNGDDKTGVSLMKLTAGMDEGPVYAEKGLPLSGIETRPELYERLADMGSELLSKNLEAIIGGALQPVEQDSTAATYTKLIKKADGELDFGQPAEVLQRQVRAYAGWPRSRAEVFGQKIIVTKAHVANNSIDGTLVIKCQPGYLEIEELIAPSGKKMAAAEFVRGYSKT